MLARWLVLCVLITAARSEVFYFEEVQRSRLADDASTCGWRYSFLTNSYEYVCEFLTETARWNADSSPEDEGQLPRKRKWSKRRQHDSTKVNFILINKGVNYKQQDRSKNTHQQVDIRGNCIMIVGHDNNCYGWNGKKDRGKQQNKPPVDFQGPPEELPAQFQVPTEDQMQADNWPQGPYEIQEAHNVKVIEEVEVVPEVVEKEVDQEKEKAEIEIKEAEEAQKIEEAEAAQEIEENPAVPETQETQAAPEEEENDAEIEIKEAEEAGKIEAEADKTSDLSGSRSKGKKKKNHKKKGKKRKNRRQKPRQDKHPHIRSYITF